MRRALALVLVLLAELVAPASALAHATLQSTLPERGQKLDAAPKEVVFIFDESVEGAFGALRVFDASGKEVQTGEAFHPDNRGERIAIKLKPGLGDGTYTATYRVVSADGHPISSGFVFTVGEGAAPAQSLDELLGSGTSAPVTNTALAIARGLQYSAIALGLGALIFFLVCWRPVGRVSRPFTARLEKLLLVAGVVGFVSALLAVILQGAIGSGESFWNAARPDVFTEVLGTRFGRAWGIGAAVWLVVLAVLATRPLREAGNGHASAPEDAAGNGGGTAPAGDTGNGGAAPAGRAGNGGAAPAGRAGAAPTGALAATALAAPAAAAPALAAATRPRPVLSTPKLVALAVPLFALALLPSLGGHTSVQKPVAVLMPMNVLHVLAMAAWLGGVAVLVLALRAATASVSPEERTPLLATVVGRFSTLAGPALAVLLISGSVQGIIEVGRFGALLDTPFGRSVLIKIAVALLIVAAGAYNRQKLVPALKRLTGSPGQTGVLLRRILVAELVLGVIALGATGALSSYAPSTAQSAGPFSTTVNVGPARVEVTVDPARVGPNETHVYLFDRKTGAPYEATKELRLTAEMPSKQIAKITLEPNVAGPGHYVVNAASLGVAGDWTMEITVRVSDFDEYTSKFEVPIDG
ncbi:copper resistance CopC/CopD family protein [Solirubrobacter pauli]|uniref:copper resistance CopC/CopD family protein n=1 Tax=Solirubrobacter pauli TaxID=166793 RepID=UPI001476CD78|nr:copper resistance protein CopC [Solirubrobacter pauli]